MIASFLTKSTYPMARKLRREIGIGTCLLGISMSGFTNLSAQVPDLTAGGVPTDSLYWNLGPTGMQGWFYHYGSSTGSSRQIRVTVVDAGSKWPPHPRRTATPGTPVRISIVSGHR